MTLTTASKHFCCGGELGFYTVQSEALGLPTTFGVFIPEGASKEKPVPVLYLLAGLTCTQDTFLIKSNIVRFAAKHGIALVACDTSPRGAKVPGEADSWDLGVGAGFYLDATQSPWRAHYRMGTFIGEELPKLVAEQFPVDASKQGICGHSMGGHGALVHALRSPEKWKSVSAFAPIVHPTAVPWGEKAFTAYLGPDKATWAQHDATLLIKAGHTHPTTILVDQGDGDQFLERELQPWHLEEAAKAAGQKLTLRRHAGYDHSYWFIQSFIEDHMDHHTKILKG
ncbi:S-formylglutathione hydrolase [Acetobacter conturbans]|uniref:S-formylglutathione hydrolase n=1 Tax=Acetobacter conturbans TaxID=1737472 RepID=A0ABX0K2F8_9PROT|nr:S-formylglutathione hydrolase [Acetobacter conturbans]NHN89001.1 S-formylglutathione hydrolase [Acetobacter conturbans]